MTVCVWVTTLVSTGAEVAGVAVSVVGGAVVGVPVSVAGGAESTAEGTVSVWVTTVVAPPPLPLPLPPLRSWRVGDADAVVGAAEEVDVDTGEVAVPDVSFTVAIAIPATTTTASAPPATSAGPRRYHGVGGGGLRTAT